ncbi:MAG: amylo-alpha-1,6-glucosidase [Methylocapsa sp.]|nr:amylo-alpha-1,6-glucosidase [Methylocapsa sp.]
MAFKIPIGPPHLALHQGNTVLLTERDGQINFPSDKGLYFLDTRLLGSWQIYANGVPWELLNSASISHYAARINLINPVIPAQEGDIGARSVGLVIGRWIDGGLHEDLTVCNYGAAQVRFDLELALRCDFADLFDVKQKRLVRRGQIATEWVDDDLLLRNVYRHKDFCRELAVIAGKYDSKPVFANGRITFRVELPPGGKWQSCLLYELGDGKTRLQAPRGCIETSPLSRAGRSLANWRGAVLKIRTANGNFQRVFEQAVDDMAALRLPFERTGHLEFLPAGGVPWFVAFFGRDSLIAALQNTVVYPAFAKGALDALGALQANERDDYRDAEPGKIVHELRLGELAHFRLIPHTPYYGTADATILYLIVLHTAWRCTGEAQLLEQHLTHAENCLDWIEKYGDRDGDGFQEYETRSRAGYENQSWKDAGNAVVYPDGSLVKGPKALCELQGYVYDAWLRMAEIYDFLGNEERAHTLERKAGELCRRFNDAFWDEECGFYAYALDGNKKKVMTVASNIGHCLWSGIVAKERAGKIVARLMEADMFSGWGIRTLSAKNPAYNPHSYQNGSVWPHDNAILAMGLRRYGFVREALQIAGAVTDAAGHFALHQIPELYAGIQREATNFPVQYLGANVPQAWAAGSVFMLLQAILGFEADAPRQMLYLDPVLPVWLPDLELRNVHVGQCMLDLRFWREGGKTRFEVLKGPAEMVLCRSYSQRRI